MKAILGLLLLLGAAVLGLYCGVWWAFIGGIVDVINEVRAPDLSALAVAIGVAKIMFAGVIGYVAFVIPGAFGLALLQDA